jgi:pyruvate dehydrogenase E2 component (dihydrolipoamide acetyltransferase)
VKSTAPLALLESNNDHKSVVVPDIGDFKDVPIIDILVKIGDIVQVDDPVITLESDKAVMEVPTSFGGKVTEILATIGQKVSQGTIILKLAPEGAFDVPAPAEAPRETPAPKKLEPETFGIVAAPIRPIETAQPNPLAPAHASPSVRGFARELGVEINDVVGSGPKGRIVRDDLANFVKRGLQKSSASSEDANAVQSNRPALLPWPQIDFSQFGAIERQPLSRLRKISGPNLARNWAIIPHVTNFDEADVTDLEELRKQINAEHAKTGVKVTMLAFMIRAMVTALKNYPEFNASLDGDDLILKRYFNIGFAADTPNGLLVPVKARGANDAPPAMRRPERRSRA